ncbi:MAG: hypothetical protein Q9M48_03740 [Rhodobacterales bacterium]|nr:hypothetical protein [Rhodobacterales bacterium]
MITRLATILVLSGLLGAGLFGGAATAQEHSALLPVVPKATGEAHPEGNAFMRINHMKLLRHDRDDTMRNGNRDIDYSLKECVACHVQTGADALPIPINSEGQFCSACHEFAAVKIDCFQCHNTRPELNETQALLSRPLPDAAALSAYLDEVTE